MAEAHALQAAFLGTHLHGVEEDFELINLRQEVCVTLYMCVWMG